MDWIKGPLLVGIKLQPVMITAWPDDGEGIYATNIGRCADNSWIRYAGLGAP